MDSYVLGVSFAIATLFAASHKPARPIRLSTSRYKIAGEWKQVPSAYQRVCTFRVPAFDGYIIADMYPFVYSKSFYKGL